MNTTASKAAIAAVLLTLVGAQQFRRRDLKGVDGITAEIRKGDTIRVTEETADKLTAEAYGTHDGDNDYKPYFVVAAEGTVAKYDFTVPFAEKVAAEKAARTTTHDLTTLPKTEELSGANVPKRSQRPAPRN